MIQKPTAMVESLKNKQDQALFERFCKLPIFPFYKLISPKYTHVRQQKQEFFTSGATPVFSYPKAQTFDIKRYLQHVNECINDIQSMHTKDWIRYLYLAKLDELKTRALLIKAMQKNDDQKVACMASSLFGIMQCSRPDVENELKTMVNHAQTFYIHKKPITAGKFSCMVQKTLDHYGMTNWHIRHHAGSSVKLSRSRHGTKFIVYIPKNFSASVARAKRVLIHEIEVHALRTHNGAQSPLHILRIGLDHYLETDEGLALHHQSQRGGKVKQFLPGFWETYACVLSQELNFQHTFEALLAKRKTLDTAIGRCESEKKQMNKVWNMCVRTYRGIARPNSPGLGTCKDHIYRSGLYKIQNVDIENKTIQKYLFAGNLGIHHMNLMKHLNLDYVKTPDLVNT